MLQAGTINTVNASASSVEQFGWSPYLDHVGDPINSYTAGATVFRAQSLEALPKDIGGMFEDMTKRVSHHTLARERKADEGT
jgi:hypothetical protein